MTSNNKTAGIVSIMVDIYMLISPFKLTNKQINIGPFADFRSYQTRFV